MPSFRNALFLVGAFPIFCFSQDLIKNPNFDSDIAGWTVSSEADWTSSQNYPAFDGDEGGSLVIKTSGVATAEQCVAIPTAAKSVPMFLDYEIRYGASDQVDPCATLDQVVTVSMESWEGAGCDTSNSIKKYVFFSWYDYYLDDGWEHETAAVAVSNDATHIRVEMSAKCTTHRGTTTVYFDNFRMRSDRIFADTFRD